MAAKFVFITQESPFILFSIIMIPKVNQFRIVINLDKIWILLVAVQVKG